MKTRQGYGEATRWLVHRLEQAEANVCCGAEVDAARVLAEEPDAVIVATGSRPRTNGYSSHRPDVAMLPGADGPNVLSVFDVFLTPDRLGKHVVVVDEDPHQSAVFVAEHLAEGGHRVTIVAPGVHPGRDTQIGFVPELYRRVTPKGVAFRTGLLVTGIEPHALHFTDRYSGATGKLDAVDSVVLAMGNVAEDALYFDLKGRVDDLRRVGDCLAPRQIDQAIFEGERAGRTV